MANIIRQVTVFCKRNSATILTVAGGAGVIATTVLAVKATPKALTLIEKAKEEKGEDLTKFEMVLTAGPAYIPTIATGVGTLTCIFGANILNQRKQASLVSAYTLLDSSFKEYKKKVNELYGEDADLKVKEEVAKNKYEEEDIKVDDNKLLYYDTFSGRYFESTSEDVLKAAYTLNKLIVEEGCACVNEFYDLLDIPGIDGGDDIGWSVGALADMYWSYWLDFQVEKTTIDGDLECRMLIMEIEPTAEALYDY